MLHTLAYIARAACGYLRPQAQPHVTSPTGALQLREPLWR